MPRKIGLLTDLQVKVLKLRSQGLSLRQISKKLGTSPQNILVAEKRALNNIKISEETVLVYKLITSPLKIKIAENTHLVDIPRIILSRADDAGVKVKADFTLIYKLIHFKVGKCIEGTRTVKPLLIIISKDGDIEVLPYEIVKQYNELLKDP